MAGQISEWCKNY